MRMIILLLNLSFLAGLSYWIWHRTKSLRPVFLPALFFKLLCGIGIGLIYFDYYKTGDTLLYHADGVLLADIARQDINTYWRILFSSPSTLANWPVLQLQEPRAVILIKVVSLFHLVSGNSYWITSLYFSMLSFLGVWFLVQCIHRHLPQTTPAAVIAFLALPSAVFWSSGLIKESLSMASLFFLTGIFLQIWFSEKIKNIAHWFLIPVAALILWNLKYYFAAIFFLVVITCLLFKFISPRLFKSADYGIEILVWMLLLIAPLILVSFLHPNFYPHRFLSVVVENYHAFSKISAPEDLIQFRDLQPQPVSMLVNVPWALISGLFRPFIWEVGNTLQLMASLENLLLLILSFVGVYHIRPVGRSPHRILLMGVLTYIVSLCIFITLSTPNFGTLSRYRVSYLPFFFYILCCSKPVLTILQRSFNHLVRIKR